jgi:endonuclease/exonuclease/phosphatase family metal-dependent hydrolase
MRIVTYNTRGSLGMDGTRSTRRIVETVRALSPDIVCFQEIHQRLPWSGREDQPAILGKMLGRTCLFQRNLHFGFGGYGVAIAFRGDLVASTEHLLPSAKEQRGALEVRLRNVGGLRSLTVFCTHWGLQVEERARQADALSGLIKAAPGPVVVCGDLNEKPEGDGVRHLLACTWLRDAGSRQNQPTFVSDNPTARIDYILHAPELVVQNVEVISSLASDHLPVLADLTPTPLS